MTILTPFEFLQRVWPSKLLTNETLELRYIDRKTKAIHRAFYTSIEDFLRSVEKYQNYEVYFGVSTRFGTGGGKKKDCYRSKVVWMDLDNRELGDFKAYPKPDIVVDSGGGLHVYWILKNPVLVRNEIRGAQLEAVNRGLAEKFGGDVCEDLTRILRVPGTLNHKYNPAKKITAYEL